MRVRIPGLESFNEGSEEEYVALESEEAKSSFHEETSSASPERRRAAKIRLSHEDVRFHSSNFVDIATPSSPNRFSFV